jgi:hypothetical protein
LLSRHVSYNIVFITFLWSCSYVCPLCFMMFLATRLSRGQTWGINSLS